MKLNNNNEPTQLKLARAFDYNLHTKQWHNIVDYIIIGMILLSALEIFLSTYNIDPTLRKVLWWVDIATLVFFTIEVSLRIWVAPYMNPKYRGLKGRLRYCFSFHGFVDCVSTYPYYLQWIIPFPIAWIRLLRMTRVMRLFRVSRYMKSWNLLKNAIYEKRKELVISMQFLVVITFILSIILFYAEHNAQPEKYDNGFSSVLWAFAQYIGDPGGFGDNAPITIGGRIIACVVGLLGIAIVAVPAGILGAGFTEAIEKEAKKKELQENQEKLRLSFERKLDRPSGFQVVPPYRTLTHIQSRQDMTTDDIINTIKVTPGYRLVNLGATIPIEKNQQDVLAVEHFVFNKPYGCLIDRNSKVTIVAPASFVDDCTGFFAWYLAEIGGFNFISREFGNKAPYKSFFAPGNVDDENLKEYLKDAERLAKRPGSWIITFLVASGANEPEYDTQIHFGTGTAKGDESVGRFIADKEKYSQFYSDLSNELQQQFNIQTDNGRYHATTSPNMFIHKIEKADDCNCLVMRVAWSAMLWNGDRIKLARCIAEHINRDLLGLPSNPENPKLHTKNIGFV